MKTRILVTGAGGPAAQSVLKALSPGPYSVCMGDADANAAGLFLVPKSQRTLLPRGDAPGFVDAVLRAAKRLETGVVWPTCDAELVPLADAGSTFERHGIKLILPSADSLRLCLDKLTLTRTLEGVIPVPRTVLVDEHFDRVGFVGAGILKPRTGSGSRGIRAFDDSDSLSDVPRNGQWIVQELMVGTEYSIDVLATPSGKVLAAVPRERMKVDSGVAVTSRTTRDPELIRLAAKAVETVGLGFVSNVQLKRGSDGVARLLEINPRVPGTMPLTVAAGINMPLLALRQLVEGKNIEVPSTFEELVVVRYLQEKFVPVAEFEVSDLGRP